MERHYDSASISRIGFPDTSASDSVTLSVNKNDGAGIFTASSAVKTAIDTELAQPKYAGIAVAYANDQADLIGDDYQELMHEALVTL